MSKLLTITAMIVALSTGGAAAACPQLTPGETAAEIKANEQRIVCLQRELAEQSRDQRQQFQIDTLSQSLHMLELQRRFDALQQPSFVTPVPALP